MNAEIVVAVNKSTILECFVEEFDKGYPDHYYYTWKRNNDDDFNVSTVNGKLTLTPHDTAWQDTYTCHPYNIAGVGQGAQIFLRIKGWQYILFTKLLNLIIELKSC